MFRALWVSSHHFFIFRSVRFSIDGAFLNKAFLSLYHSRTRSQTLHLTMTSASGEARAEPSVRLWLYLQVRRPDNDANELEEIRAVHMKWNLWYSNAGNVQRRLTGLGTCKFSSPIRPAAADYCLRFLSNRGQRRKTPIKPHAQSNDPPT